MTFPELKADATTLRAGNEGVFEDLEDAELQELNRTEALNILRLDLEQAMSLEPNTDKLDEITEVHELRLKQALAHKQLFLYYFEHDDGEGSRSRIRMDTYKREYASAQAMFGKLKQPTTSQTTFVRIAR